MLGNESSGTKRLVLGFDGGCCTCSGMADRIEEQVGDKLEVMSLRNPQVQEWRSRAIVEIEYCNSSIYECTFRYVHC